MRQSTLVRTVPRWPQRQRGMSLIIGLLMLTLLTLLALAGMEVATLQGRMAGNTQDRMIALNAAEAALRDCEQVLQNASLPPFDGTNGLYRPAPLGTAPVWTNIDWTQDGTTRIYSNRLSGVMLPPRCIIEELPPLPRRGGDDSLAAGRPLPELGLYRVTAKGYGTLRGTVVTLQTTYVR